MNLKTILSDDNRINILRTMKTDGSLEKLFKLPEGYSDWDMDQNTPYHKLTVWEHTLLALKNLNDILDLGTNISEDDRFLCNVAILLHDVGKLNPKVHGFKKDKKGARTTYYNHEKYSLIAAAEMLSGQLSELDINIVQSLIEGSSRVNPNYRPGNEACNLTNKTLSKFVISLGDRWQLAIFLNMADACSKGQGGLKDFDFYYHSNMMEKIRCLGPKKVMRLKPLLTGQQVIDIIGKKPGPWVGEILSKMLEWQMKNPKSTVKDAEGFVKAFK